MVIKGEPRNHQRVSKLIRYADVSKGGDAVDALAGGDAEVVADLDLLSKEDTGVLHSDSTPYIVMPRSV
jgi:hypothetical protein